MAQKVMKEASLANLKAPWQKGESGNPKGRPRNRVKELHKKLGILKRQEDLEPREINSIEKGVLTMRLSELQALAKDDRVSVLEKGYAMAVIIDMKNGRTTTIDKLRDRQYGATVQTVELTGKNGKDLNPTIQVEVIDSRTQVDRPEVTAGDDQEEDEDTDNENL